MKIESAHGAKQKKNKKIVNAKIECRTYASIAHIAHTVGFLKKWNPFSWLMNVCSSFGVYTICRCADLFTVQNCHFVRKIIENCKVHLITAHIHLWLSRSFALSLFRSFAFLLSRSPALSHSRSLAPSSSFSFFNCALCVQYPHYFTIIVLRCCAFVWKMQLLSSCFAWTCLLRSQKRNRRLKCESKKKKKEQQQQRRSTNRKSSTTRQSNTK